MTNKQEDTKIKPDWVEKVAEIFGEFPVEMLPKYIAIVNLFQKQEEQHKMERDYIVVKDQKVAKDLVTKYKGKDLRGKWIIIAPNGLEFVSEEDIKRLPVIQKLKQQHEKELQTATDIGYDAGYKDGQAECRDAFEAGKQQGFDEGFDEGRHHE